MGLAILFIAWLLLGWGPGFIFLRVSDVVAVVIFVAWGLSWIVFMSSLGDDE